jgi:peptidoglycan/LPS O-acetylase OafA/YrhL
MLAFAPALHGLIQPDSPYAIFGTPAFSLINGGAAVVPFFVLSGFVLTFRAMENGNAAALVSAAMRRWPRLAMPALASTLLAACLMVLGLYASQQAAVLSGSLWLSWFFGWQSTGLEAITESAKQSLFSVFLGRENSYNPNLWTMHYELFGSFIAYACAACAIHVSRPALSVSLLIAAWIATMTLSPYFSTFLLGVALAKVYVTMPEWEWQPGVPIAVAGVAVFLFGYADPLRATTVNSDWYALLRPLEGSDAVPLPVFLHSIAAAGFIILALWSPSMRRLLRAPIFA